MTQEAKSLKIAGIAALFLGLACVIVAVVYALMAFDLTDVLQFLSGASGLFLGARGARSANVPSSAEKVITPSVVVGCLSSIFAGAVVYLNGLDSILIQLVCIVVMALCALIIALSAHRIKKALERK